MPTAAAVAASPAPLADHLGHTVRTLRKAHGLTQSQVADRIGMHYSKVENGQRALSIEAVATLADLFAVPIDDLVRGRATDGEPGALPPEPDVATADALERARLIDSLAPDDRAIVFRLIDSLVGRQRLRDYLEANLEA